MLDQRLGVAQRHSHRHQVQGVHQLHAGGTAPLDLEGQHTAEVAHLAAGDVMAGMVDQAGIVDLLHGGVVIQELCNGLGVGAVLLHTDLQGLQAAEDQEGAEGIHHCAGHILQAEHTYLIAEFGGAHHKARDHVAVAVQVLGGGVHHHVCAQLQRPLEVRGSEGVVADDLDVLVVAVGQCRHGRDVRDLQVGVGGRLQIHRAGVGLQRLAHGIQVGGVHKADLHAVAGHAVVQKGEGAAIQGAVGHDMLAGAGYGPQRGGDGTHAGGGGHAGLTAFQGSDLGLQHRGGGVGQAGVDIARFFTGEAAPALLTAVKYEGGGLENRGGQCAVLGVLHVSGVNGFCTEAAILVQHGSSSLHYNVTIKCTGPYGPLP